jgi:hypothetical protein
MPFHNELRPGFRMPRRLRMMLQYRKIKKLIYNVKEFDINAFYKCKNLNSFVDEETKETEVPTEVCSRPVFSPPCEGDTSYI